MCRRAKIFLDVPRFCEEESQPGGKELRPAFSKAGIGSSSLGEGVV